MKAEQLNTIIIAPEGRPEPMVDALSAHFLPESPTLTKGRNYGTE
jgi:hypothetical protein